MKRRAVAIFLAVLAGLLTGGCTEPTRMQDGSLRFQLKDYIAVGSQPDVAQSAWIYCDVTNDDMWIRSGASLQLIPAGCARYKK